MDSEDDVDIGMPIGKLHLWWLREFATRGAMADAAE